MPMEKSRSGLAAKYGKKLDDAVKNHANDEMPVGMTNLPAGIVNGVAKLVKCGFGVYKAGTNKGEYFFRAAAVVVEPHSVINPATQREEVVENRQSSIMEPVCDTKTQAGKVTTCDEHIARILGHMKKLAGSAEFGQGATAAQLEGLAAELEATNTPPNDPIYFRLDTSVRKALKQGDQDGVWENWNDRIEGYVQKDGSQEGVGMEDHSNGQMNAEEPFTEPEQGEVEGETQEEPAEEPGEGADAQTEGNEPDLDALAEAADSRDDSDSQATLKAMAIELGHDEQVVLAANNWAEVVEMIRNSQVETEGSAEEGAEEVTEEQAEEPETPPPPPAKKPAAKPATATPAKPPVKPNAPPLTAKEPKVGTACRYQEVGKDGKPVIDAKTKKAKKPVDVKVLKTDKAKKTAVLQQLDNPKVSYSNIPWAKVLPPE